MTPEAQRIAIAEACGYSDVSFDDRQHVDIDSRSIQMWTQWMGAKHGVRIRVPDYLNDLNAMHEAEKVLSNVQRERYVTELVYNHAGCNVFSTAAQRAEVFIKTIGEWETSK